MNRPHQFTLAHLFWETFWIAAALACFVQMPGMPSGLRVALNLLGVVCACAAIGGLFGKMSNGFWVGVALAVCFGLLFAPLLLMA
jgi:hypothetical protein